MPSRNLRASLRVIALVAIVALTTPIAAVPAAAGASDEAGFVSRINSARASAGLPGLEVYWDLTDDARRHTADMIEAGEIFHSPNLANVTSGWSALGENVGVGADVAQLHDAFMASSGHRANILASRFNYVGVGADHGGDGYLYVTVIFMEGPPGLVSPPAEEPSPEQEVTPPPQKEPPPSEENTSTTTESPPTQSAAPPPTETAPAPPQRETPPPPDEPEPPRDRRSPPTPEVREPVQPTPLASFVLELFAQGRVGCSIVLCIE